jgi:crotonobetainyl-CoA:carnitine CoA-transferase CaiB-like acyl-CoA transferase
MGPWSGIHVLDFTRVLAGPFCTMNLADLGADVIKVESTGGGDDTRAWGPPFLGSESAYYLCVNRNKRSIALDLKAEEGKRVVRKLLEWADVVVHNFLPKSAEKLGLTYESVCSVNKEVIYCSISGYGKTENRPGYDYIMQAIGGLMSITGERGRSSMKVGVALTDLFTGLYATNAIQSALVHRMKTGEGQEIDMALYDAQIAMLANVASNVLVSGQDAEKFGNEHPNIVPYQLFRTKDGEVVVTVGNDHQFQSFCRVFRLQSLSGDRMFETNASRVQNRDALITAIQTCLAELSTDEVIEKAMEAGIPCGPVRSVKEALLSAETKNRNMIWETNHPMFGALSLVGSPLKMSKTPPALHLPPPRLGEHTRKILAEQGFTEFEIQEIIDKGVVSEC